MYKHVDEIVPRCRWSWRCGNWKMSCKCQCDSWRLKRWKRQSKIFCPCSRSDRCTWIQRSWFLVLEEPVLSFRRWGELLFWHHNCISLYFSSTNVCHGLFHLQAQSFWTGLDQCCGFWEYFVQSVPRIVTPITVRENQFLWWEYGQILMFVPYFF